MNLTVQNLLCQDARIQDLYFNTTEMKLSITSLYIVYDAPKYDIIWTENSDVINSFISEILKYKSWILTSSHKRFWTVRFTPSEYMCTNFQTLLHMYMYLACFFNIHWFFNALVRFVYSVFFFVSPYGLPPGSLPLELSLKEG